MFEWEVVGQQCMLGGDGKFGELLVCQMILIIIQQCGDFGEFVDLMFCGDFEGGGWVYEDCIFGCFKFVVYSCG